MFAFKVVLFVFFAAILVWSGRKAFSYDRHAQMPKLERPKTVLVLLALLVGFVVAMQGIGQVPAGHRGVVMRFGAVTGRVLGEGLYQITPGIESVELMDVQVHAHKTPANAASRDLQDVKTEITLTFRIDPLQADQVYRELRQDYAARVIGPSVQEAVKAATAEHDAEQLIQQRVKVRQQMEDALRERLGRHGIIVDTVAITDFQFSHDFSAAIEQKVVAAQTALRAENDLRRIKVEADQRIATATAEAQAIKIQAEAIMSQGGENYVNLKAIEKWNGELPQWTGGGGSLPFINVGAAPSKVAVK